MFEIVVRYYVPDACFLFRLAQAQADLDQTMAILKEKQDKLAAVENKVVNLVMTITEDKYINDSPVSFLTVYFSLNHLLFVFSVLDCGFGSYIQAECGWER